MSCNTPLKRLWYTIYIPDDILFFSNWLYVGHNFLYMSYQFYVKCYAFRLI